AGGGERALELVAAHDLPHVDEDRGVGIAQLDDVDEHLLLPGIGHRRGVVEPVTVERHRSVARAAGEVDRAYEDADPRGTGTNLDRERVRHCAATPSTPPDGPAALIERRRDRYPWHGLHGSAAHGAGQPGADAPGEMLGL